MLEGVFGVLAFLATLLVSAIGLIWAGVALLTNKKGQAWRIGRSLLVWLGVYVILLLVFSLTSRPRFYVLGEERCYDEMCHSVQAVRVAQTLGEGPTRLTAQGRFYVVTIRLRNTARRTAQRPSMAELFVLDAAGRRYTRMINAGESDNFTLGQPVTARELWSQPVQPGEVMLRTIAIDLPVDVQRPGLVMTEGIGPLALIIIADEDSYLHAKNQFELLPEKP
jgi:hypothetical protein